MTPQNRVDQLTSELARIKAEVVRVERQLQEARGELAGIRVGDLVTANADTYKVVEVIFNSLDKKPWVRGVAKTRGGKWSNNSRHLYEKWTKLP